MFKRSIFVSALLLPSFCVAGVQFKFTSRKSGHQSGRKTVTYTGGDLKLFVQDGSWELSKCGHPSAVRISPDPPDCPLGTTAYIALGDLDGDGVRDDGSFWSLAAAPTSAKIINPMSSVGLRVESAPPSLFPRPVVEPVTNGSVVLWYNMLTTEQREYGVTRYAYNQEFPATPYGRRKHDRTVVIGAYKFSVPWIGDPEGNARQIVGLNKMPMPESYPGLDQSPLKWGFRFTNDTWNQAGELQFDPRLFNEIKWEGINDSSGNNVFRAVDTMRMWMERVPAAGAPVTSSPFDVPSSTFDPQIVYPPAGGSILFDNPARNSYRLPALFFTVGSKARMHLHLERNHSTGVASDHSVRVWTVDLAFVDTYEGFSRLGGSFPPGTPAEQRDPYYDFDGDGMSNIAEYALGSKPGDPSSVAIVQPAVRNDGLCEVTLNKRPDTGTTLSYAVEYTLDMVHWTRIQPGDPNWDIIVDDSSVLTVRTKQPSPNVTCFVRANITVNAL